MSLEKGFTNIAGGTVSGQTNPKNDHLFSDPKEKSFTLRKGDGTILYYNKLKQKGGYILHTEERPNGGRIQYTYKDGLIPVKIEAFNKQGPRLVASPTSYPLQKS